MYAALACYRKSKNFEDIPFLPKIYNSVTKNPKTCLNPKKTGNGEGMVETQSQDVLLK